jgi:Fe-S-cluster-containing hydrogenase component 2
MKRWEKEGVIEVDELDLPDEMQLKKGVAIIECVQEIPCNPCIDICPVQAISMETVHALPKIDYQKCIGCGQCVEICPGLAIFLIKNKNSRAQVMLPYELLPLPDKGQTVTALDREGKELCDAIVTNIKSNSTTVITIELPKNHLMTVRNIRVVK